LLPLYWVMLHCRCCYFHFFRDSSLCPLTPAARVASMFVVGASYLSLLQCVAARCGLPYASVVFEVAADGTPVYGVELDVPSFDTILASHRFFFWAPSDEFSGAGYEQAALQAVAPSPSDEFSGTVLPSVL